MKRNHFLFLGLLAAMALAVSLATKARAQTDSSSGSKSSDVLFLFNEPSVQTGTLGKMWTDLLTARGISSRSMLWNDFTPADLSDTRCVVIVPPSAIFTPDDPLSGGRPGPRDFARLDAIEKFVQAGGGLLFGQEQTQMLKSLYFLYAIADRFQASVLFENVSDPGTATIGGARRWNLYRAGVTGPAEIAAGCKNVWYPQTALAGYCGVLPILAKDGWQPILTASPTARSETAWCGLDFVDRRRRAEGFQQGGFPLAAVRSFGQGRVGYLGVNTQFLALRQASLTADAAIVSRDGLNGVPSDLQKLTLNLIAWLKGLSTISIDASAATAVTLPPLRQFAVDNRLYRGVIGAATTYSTGQSTPDEYVAAAKAAGLDYIAFTEDLAHLTSANYEKLCQDCQRLSDAKFLAFPGLRFEDEYGNQALAFGYGLEMPSAAFLNEKRQLLIHPPLLHETLGNAISYLGWLYSLSGFNVVSTFYKFHAIPYYDARDVDGMAMIIERDGQVTPTNLSFYGNDEGDGQMRLPLALAFMNSADDLARTKYRNVVFASGIKQLAQLPTYRAFGNPDWVHGPSFWPDTAKTFISSGPEVTVQPGVSDAYGYSATETKPPFPPDTGVFFPQFWSWPVGITASSPQGLSDIFVYDGPQLIRHFRLDGKPEKFQQTVYLASDREHHFWVRVLDAAGGEALSREVATKTGLMQELNCGDRNNQLFYSDQRRPDGSHLLLSYGGPTAMPDKGPWNGSMRPAGYWTFDAKYGVERAGFYDGSPEQSPTAVLVPELLAVGHGRPVSQPNTLSTDLLAGVEGPPHVHPERVVASDQALVADRVLDGVFPPGSPSANVWSTLLPVTPSKLLQTTARTTIYRIKPDGISAILWHQDFKLLQPVTPDPKLPFYLQLGRLGSYSTGWAVQTGSAPVQTGKMQASHQEFLLNKGDWFGLYGGNLGSVFIFVLSDGLKVQFPGQFVFGFASPKNAVLPAGTERHMDLLLVGMNRLTKDPVALAQQVSRAYGLDGRAPGYKIDLSPGAQVAYGFPTILKAGSAGSVQGQIDTPPTGFPGNIPLQIDGLNPNSSAVWEEQTDHGPLLIEPLPQENGTGYLALDPDPGPRHFFAGNPLVTSDPDVRLNINQDPKKGWLVEVHNPTSDAKEVRLSTAPGFLTFHLDTTVNVPPMSSAIVYADSAHGE